MNRMAGTALWGLLGSGVGAGGSGAVSLAGNQLDGDTEFEPSDKLAAVVAALSGLGLGSMGGYFGHPEARLAGQVVIVDRASPQGGAPGGGMPPSPGLMPPAAPAPAPVAPAPVGPAGPALAAGVEERIEEIAEFLGNYENLPEEDRTRYFEELQRTEHQEVLLEASRRMEQRRRA